MSNVYVVEFLYDYEGGEAKFASATLDDCFAYIDREDLKLNEPDGGFKNRHGDHQSVTRFAPLAVENWMRSTGDDGWMHRVIVDGKWTVQR